FMLDSYRALEKRLRNREEDIEKLRADNGCLRKELASLRQTPTTATPQNADNRALVKTQMNLLKREIVSQRETLAQLKRKGEWMKKCLSWYSKGSNLQLPKELAQMPPLKNDDSSSHSAE
ncbi:Kinesin member, partial [Perkinsus olseni]